MAAKPPTPGAGAGAAAGAGFEQRNNSHLDFSHDTSGLHPVQPGLEPLPIRDENAPEVFATGDKGQAQALTEAVPEHKRQKILGIPRRVFWWVCGVILLIVIVVAAAVGGAVGSKVSSDRR